MLFHEVGNVIVFDIAHEVGRQELLVDRSGVVVRESICNILYHIHG
jgi:kynureninase